MMTFKSKSALVTGGAGFIGSHIVDALLERNIPVVVFDNFKTGNIENLPDDPRVNVYQGDCTSVAQLKEAMKGCDIVFHFQANADIRGGEKNMLVDFEQNTFCTLNVLRAMKDMRKKRIVFASSSAVYGDSHGLLKEDANLIQSSHYGASKLACEAMIEANASYDPEFEYAIFRFVSWVGPRYSHGCIADFVNRLLADPSKLDVLGNGHQTKSCLDVSDGINAIFTSLERDPRKRFVMNVGHSETITVIEIASLVLSQMGITGAVVQCEDRDRGWVGDNPFVLLNTDSLKSLGWVPRVSIEPAVRRTVDYLLRKSGRAPKPEAPEKG